MDEACFVSAVVIWMKNDKSIKIAIDSRKLNDSCIKVRRHMLNLEELLNTITMENSRDRTKNSMVYKIDLGYAYGQSIYPKQQVDNVCLQLLRETFSG